MIIPGPKTMLDTEIDEFAEAVFNFALADDVAEIRANAVALKAGMKLKEVAAQFHPLYSARVEFLNVERTPEGRGTGREMVVTYSSPSDHQAVVDAIRFAEGRVKALPELVCKFTAVKVYRFCPQPISEDGGCHNGIFGQLFEWKCDWPGTLEEYVEVKGPGTESKEEA